MQERCPECGSLSLTVQNIEELTNPVTLVKLMQATQLRCERCGWIGFESGEKNLLA